MYVYLRVQFFQSHLPDLSPHQDWTAFAAEETQGKNLVDAAKETGVEHFVWSTLDPTPDLDLPFAELKAKVDDYLKASGVPRTS